MGLILVLLCRLLLIGLFVLFVIVPLGKVIFKVAYKQAKYEQKSLEDFLEKEQENE